MSELPGNESRAMRRLVTLVLELGSEAVEEGGRKAVGSRSFAKTQILLQSMSVFNQRGLEETSVQDLLDAAQISRRTFYKYFSSKLDVLENIYALASRVLMVRFETELPQATNKAELIQRLIAIYADHQFSVGRIVGIMVEESMRAASPLAVHRLRMQDNMVALLQTQMQRLGESAPEPYLILGLLWAMEGASLHLLTRVSEERLPDELKNCQHELLRLWVRALA